MVAEVSLGRDDWKYDEEMWEGTGEEEDGAKPPKEKQCRQCLHWLPLDATYCAWCGKVCEEPKRR